jgi:hypothetical protein
MLCSALERQDWPDRDSLIIFQDVNLSSTTQGASANADWSITNIVVTRSLLRSSFRSHVHYKTFFAREPVLLVCEIK